MINEVDNLTQEINDLLTEVDRLEAIISDKEQKLEELQDKVYEVEQENVSMMRENVSMMREQTSLEELICEYDKCNDTLTKELDVYKDGQAIFQVKDGESRTIYNMSKIDDSDFKALHDLIRSENNGLKEEWYKIKTWVGLSS